MAVPLAVALPTAAMAQDEGSGGTLVAAIGAEPDQLDPQVTSAYVSFQVLENVFDTLVEPDENLEMVPSLAESWEVSEDGLTYTFQLRDDVTWHDGSPLTAADVVYSYGRIRESANNGWRFGTVTDVSAPDDTTVVFTLSAPTPNLLSHIGAFKGMGIVQQANVESGDITTAPIGTGPFMLESWTSGDSIELVRNDAYWGGAPSLDGVTYRFIPDPTVALTNIQAGEAHWTDNLPEQQVNSLKDSTDIVVDAVPSNDYWYFAPNQAREPFNDARVRQALAYGIDRGAIVQAATFGNAAVNQTAIPATSGWYFEYAPYTRDLDMARSLLEEAGVDQLAMDLMVVASENQAVTSAQVIAANLAEIGVTVNISQLDVSTWLADQADGNFDAFLWSWIGNLDPSDFYYAQHHSSGGFNAQGYSNPDVDALLDEAAAETDRDARKALYDQAAQLIVDDASYIYMYNPEIVMAYSPDVEGFVTRGDAAVRFDSVSLAQ
ncbi:MAG: ABC transporter substrate-binding protein [Chloroflexota bacterium]|jgi:peptide/nickel transport system substrate-binding protein